jgi:hypothetical protein
MGLSFPGFQGGGYNGVQNSDVWYRDTHFECRVIRPRCRTSCIAQGFRHLLRFCICGENRDTESAPHVRRTPYSNRNGDWHDGWYVFGESIE